jgi:hypothetical protein
MQASTGIKWYGTHIHIIWLLSTILLFRKIYDNFWHLKYTTKQVGALFGVFTTPNHQFNRWGRLLSIGTSDNPVCQPRHPIVRVLTVSTVGALYSCGTGQSGAAPDRYCALSGAPLAAALTSACTVHVAGERWSRPLLPSRCFAGAPDNPVAHRTVR